MSIDRLNSRKISRPLGGLALVYTAVAGLYLLASASRRDGFVAVVAFATVLLAVLGGTGAWRGRTMLVWVAAVGLALVALLGTRALGPFVAPAAALFLGAAVSSQAIEAAPSVRESIRADPPTTSQLLYRTAISVVGIAAGALSVRYVASFLKPFEACIGGSPTCALGEANWPAMYLLLGGVVLVAVSLQRLVGQLCVGYQLRTAETKG